MFQLLFDIEQGIVRALKEYQTQLRENVVSIFVRRGGPNYQEGLRVMREVGQEKFLSGFVYCVESIFRDCEFWCVCFFSRDDEL